PASTALRARVRLPAMAGGLDDNVRDLMALLIVSTATYKCRGLDTSNHQSSGGGADNPSPIATNFEPLHLHLLILFLRRARGSPFTEDPDVAEIKAGQSKPSGAIGIAEQTIRDRLAATLRSGH
ncbi:hypothetical protein LTR53_013058, partial [Teratosphaeriaceae sp. CCFEE 6253]